MVIKHLSPNVITKIAAGEVIERPASVVKELIENSLDAKSTYITIDIEDAGLKKIAVIDNGIGMSKEDLILSIEPHTTSKISNEDDLLNIKTLGFRGEALASIAAVSDCLLKSRPKDSSVGTQIFLQQGKTMTVNAIGIPSGTSVIIRHLFSNIPARKKFLKREVTEFHHIVNCVTRLALVNPGVGFKLLHNKKLILEYPSTEKIEDRLGIILGDVLFAGLLPLKYQDNYVNIEGFVGKPQLATKSGKWQYLYVNNRSIENSLVTNAVKEAYSNLLEATATPPYILRITLPPDAVDVNVHPRKEEVKFMMAKVIYESIKSAVATTLKKYDITYQQTFSFKGASSATARVLKDKVIPWSPLHQIKKNEEVIQIHNLYLVVQTEKGVLILDQHAAHERILYEQFLKEFKETQNQVLKKQLSKPITIELSLADAVLLESNLNDFIKLGFDIEGFGQQTFKITAVPTIYTDRNIALLISEVLEDLASEKSFTADDKSLSTIAFLACRSAIKAGDYLSPQERRDLINKLFTTETQYTCPHGRPVQVEIPLGELGKMFKRG
jgi:DNA mismatch repair protein MutL